MSIEPSGGADAKHPKCRPDPAGVARHVCKVKHDKGMLIRLACRNTNTVTAAARRNKVNRVSPHVNNAVGHVPQVCVLRIRLGEVVNEAIRGIIFLVFSSALISDASSQVPTVSNSKTSKKLLPLISSTREYAAEAIPISFPTARRAGRCMSMNDSMNGTILELGHESK